MCNMPLTAQRGLRAAGAARKGGTPGEGSPFDPLLRFISTGEFRALRRAARAPPLDPRPLFCKKAGQKTFKRQFSTSPKPLAPGASDSIRPRSGHLSGRVAPPTRVGEAGGSRNLTGGATTPSAFLWGSTPFLWARPKKWGGTAAQGKTNRQQNGEFLKPTSGRRWNPAPTEGLVERQAAKTPPFRAASLVFTAAARS